MNNIQIKTFNSVTCQESGATSIAFFESPSALSGSPSFSYTAALESYNVLSLLTVFIACGKVDKLKR